MLSIKGTLIAGAVALAMTITAAQEYRIYKLTTAANATVTQRLTEVKTELDNYKANQALIQTRLVVLETNKQEFEYGLKKALAQNPANSASATPAAVVNELCKYARCRPVEINAAGR